MEASSGQGGPDYSYQLKTLPGEAPQDQAPAAEGWEERTFSRRLSANRLNELAERGGKAQNQKSIETYRAAGEVFAIPGTLEGGLALPGESHPPRSHLAGPQLIALEIETRPPDPPLFTRTVSIL